MGLLLTLIEPMSRVYLGAAVFLSGSLGEQSVPAFDELSQRGGQERAKMMRDFLFVPLPEYSQINDRQADCREGKREEHAVLENGIGQMPDIAGGAQSAKYHEYPTRKRRAGNDHQEIDAEVDEFAGFAV